MRPICLLVVAVVALGCAKSATAADTVVTLQIRASVDDVNEVNNSLDTTSTTQWLGSGEAATGSYAGMRFTSAPIPQGSIITSAYLQVYSTQNQWISCAFSIAADDAGNSSPFTSSTRPSQRTLTANAVNHSDNVWWAANTWYSLDEMKAVVQEVVGRTDWQSGNSLSIILRDTESGAFARKFVSSFDGDAANAPRLVVSYTSSGTPLPGATVTAVNALPAAPTATFTAGGTLTSQIAASTDDVDEVDGALTTNSNEIWFGNGGSTTISYAGLRFVNVSVPAGATITSAHLEVYSSQSQWIDYAFTMAAEATGNSATFTETARPSQRAETATTVNHSDNVRWAANTWYSLDEMKAVIQEVIGRTDWQAGNSLSIVIKGTGTGTFARKFVASFDGGSPTAPRLIVSYATNSPLSPTTTMNVAPPSSVATPSTTLTVDSSSATDTYFAVGPGFSDVVPHQIIRTATDRLYLFAAQPSSTTLSAQWTLIAGLPNAGGDFSGSAQSTLAAMPISVSPAYDGGTTVHVLTNLQNGTLVDVPFDLVTNSFRPARAIVMDMAIVSGDYLGSSGVAAMVDNTGYLHVAYSTSAGQIMHAAYSYNSSSDTLTLESAPIRVDTAGAARHPSLAVSPLDNSVTVAWVSLATTPKQILARMRDPAGGWTTVENVSNTSVDVWTSTSGGIDIDQGPSLLITADGVRHVTYIENYDSTGDYGAVHYGSNNGNGWTDLRLPATYSHDPALAATAAGQLYLIGHGHPNDAAEKCKSEDDMCVSRQNPDGTWTPPSLFARHTSGSSFDSSPSVKWSVVGWNRPEVIEFLFFQTPYTAPTLFYGRIQ